MSKFSLDVLQRCVYPYYQNKDEDVLLGATFGEDVALTRVGGDILASHVDPIVGAVQNIGWLAVHVACNDIATTGAPPRWILPLVLVPQQEAEALLASISQDIARAAAETGVTVIGGHTGYSANLSRPLVAVTALGTLQGRRPILTAGAQAGDHIVITKGIGIEGTAILAHDFSQTALRLGLTQSDLQTARELSKTVSIIPEALLLGQGGATAMHDVTRGGLLETLLEIARLSGVGIHIRYQDIPEVPIVALFAQRFDFDPLQMISSGTLVATVPESKVAAVLKNLQDAGITCADIGRVFSGEGVHIEREGTTSQIQEIHCEDDELARMWTLHTPDHSH